MTDATVLQKNRELKGWHVLMWMLGFFGLMFVVNGVFLYQALVSFPGEDVEKSYLQGLNYNETLAARAAQAELGWHAQIGVVQGDLVVAIYDASDVPVSGLEFSGVVHRQYTTREDKEISFDPVGDGVYAASIEGVGQGLWGVDVSARRKGEGAVIFEATQTLILP